MALPVTCACAQTEAVFGKFRQILKIIFVNGCEWRKFIVKEHSEVSLIRKT